MNESGENKPVGSGDQGELFTGRTVSTESIPKDAPAVEPRERQSVKTIIAEFKKLIGPLQNVTFVKVGDPDSLEKLETALTRLPSGQVFGQTIDSIRKKAMEVVAVERRERVQAFRHIETDFIKSIENQNLPFRDYTEGWRIGPLELRVRRAQAQYQWLFNKEVLSQWLKVSGVDSLQRSMDKSLESLKKFALPESTLQEVFWEAYQECLRHREGARANLRLVRLTDFYRQVRLTLVNRELAQRPDKKLSFAEFPKWAFLYNLDRYSASSSTLPTEKRLGLQTGSQQETGSIGMVTNGLDSYQDYKVYCFIFQGG